MPTIDDARKVREQAVAAFSGAFEQARTPFLAALGVGDVATQAFVDAVTKARGQLSERAEQVPADVAELRGKLEPAELRKLVDQYTEAAAKLYQYLTEHGEETLERLRSQPQFKRAVEQFDQAATVAQQRAESAVGDARELADEVLGRVTRRTRSTGEKAARTATKTADEVAEQVKRAGDDASALVEEAGAEAAHDVRSTTRKAANRTASARKTTSTNGASGTTGTRSTGTGTNRKPNAGK
jgi:heparin binding hemagglutinin HbhA